MYQPEQHRTILQIAGGDAESFLQNLVSNDVSHDGLIYAALLTPQGKYLADFFVLQREYGFLIDVASPIAPALFQRLSMYRLRADVQISEAKIDVVCGFDDMPEDAVPDPRHPALGWRKYGGAARASYDWPALRLLHSIPETGIELGADTFILEAGFERLNGVDFKKGCYVGQEVTARMKHKTELRKGLRQVKVSGRVAAGTPILSKEKPAGVLYTNTGGLGLAYLRFDRITPDMTAGDAIINA